MGEMEELLERVERSLIASRHYVALYESEHMSNKALDVFIENEACCEALRALIKEKTNG